MYKENSFYDEIMAVEGGFAAWSTLVNSRMEADEADIDALELALSGKFNNPSGTTAQYVAGDGSLITFPSIPSTYTNEMAQDAVGGILSAEFVYDDGGNSIKLRDYAISTPTFSSATTATKLSSTRKAFVSYSFDSTVSITLLAGQTVTATLRYADNVGMSTNVVVVKTARTSNGGVLGLSQTNNLDLFGYIPADKHRQVTFTVSGGASNPSVLTSGQETLL